MAGETLPHQWQISYYFFHFGGGGYYPKAQRFRVTSCQVKEQTDPVFPTHNDVAHDDDDDDDDDHDDDA